MEIEQFHMIRLSLDCVKILLNILIAGLVCELGEEFWTLLSLIMKRMWGFNTPGFGNRHERVGIF